MKNEFFHSKVKNNINNTVCFIYLCIFVLDTKIYFVGKQSVYINPFKTINKYKRKYVGFSLQMVIQK